VVPYRDMITADYIPRRTHPGPSKAERDKAHMDRIAAEARANAAAILAAQKSQPDHEIERWDMVILRDDGPRYRVCAMPVQHTITRLNFCPSAVMPYRVRSMHTEPQHGRGRRGDLDTVQRRVPCQSTHW
jgi:hypothetical protein